MLKKKLAALQNYLRGLGRIAVAFSGGVDSTFLLNVAHEVVGDDVIAVTAVSKLIPRREVEEASEFCCREGIRQVTFDFDPFTIKGFEVNPPDRCYICKRAVFARVKEIAEVEGAGCVVEGSNVDDVADYRPGMRALAELGIKSPLRLVDLRKSEIRILSADMNLSTAEKPSMACLATRFVYGELITVEKLSVVERAEEFLRSEGFRQFRVRVHGNLARIEVDSVDFAKFMDLDFRKAVVDNFRSLGFDFVALDLCGYRTGSMNVGIF